MRKATASTSFLLDSDGALMGLSTGSDPCSEHEGGIGGLRQALGVPQKFARGLADRTMARIPPVLHFHAYALPDGTPAAWWALAGPAHISLIQHATATGAAPLPFGNELGFGPGQDLVCAWDENGLMVHARTADQVALLRQLHEQAQARNLVLGGALLPPAQKRDTAGIVLLRADRVDPAMADQALAQDQSQARLRAAAAAIGLDRELREAGCKWFALSPRWKDKNESEVVYWLNPANQHDFQYGLYSADQLRQWARGEGPVIIDKPLRAQARALEKSLADLRRAMHRAGVEPPMMGVAWASKAKKSIRVRCSYPSPSKPGVQRLDTGNWKLEDLQALYPAPVRAPRKKKAAP